jgi:hypothetical protein
MTTERRAIVAERSARLSRSEPVIQYFECRSALAEDEMMQLKTILCPVDFFKASARALDSIGLMC